MIRRLKRARIPSELHEAGWRLHHGPYGWQCLHLRGHYTLPHPAPGSAIEEAWHEAEPDHDRLLKRQREQWKARQPDGP